MYHSSILVGGANKDFTKKERKDYLQSLAARKGYTSEEDYTEFLQELLKRIKSEYNIGEKKLIDYKPHIAKKKKKRKPSKKKSKKEKEEEEKEDIIGKLDIINKGVNIKEDEITNRELELERREKEISKEKAERELQVGRAHQQHVINFNSQVEKEKHKKEIEQKDKEIERSENRIKSEVAKLYAEDVKKSLKAFEKANKKLALNLEPVNKIVGELNKTLGVDSNVSKIIPKKISRSFQHERNQNQSRVYRPRKRTPSNIEEQNESEEEKEEEKEGDKTNYLDEPSLTNEDRTRSLFEGQPGKIPKEIMDPIIKIAELSQKVTKDQLMDIGKQIEDEPDFDDQSIIGHERSKEDQEEIGRLKRELEKKVNEFPRKELESSDVNKEAAIDILRQTGKIGNNYLITLSKPDPNKPGKSIGLTKYEAIEKIEKNWNNPKTPKLREATFNELQRIEDKKKIKSK